MWVNRPKELWQRPLDLTFTTQSQNIGPRYWQTVAPISKLIRPTLYRISTPKVTHKGTSLIWWVLFWTATLTGLVWLVITDCQVMLSVPQVLLELFSHGWLDKALHKHKSKKYHKIILCHKSHQNSNRFVQTDLDRLWSWQIIIEYGYAHLLIEGYFTGAWLACRLVVSTTLPKNVLGETMVCQIDFNMLFCKKTQHNNDIFIQGEGLSKRLMARKLTGSYPWVYDTRKRPIHLQF